MPDFYQPDIEALSWRELEHLQLERLGWQLERVYRESPFYRQRFDGYGADPSRLSSLADIKHFPVVTKDELRQEQADHPPFGRYTLAPKASWRELHPSSGTTGVPVSTLWSAEDVENITQFTARTLYGIGVRPGDTVQNAFSYGLWVAGMSVHYAAKRLGCLVIPIGAAMTDRQIFYLQNAGPTVLLATPSYALYIGEKMREAGIGPDDISLRLGHFGGEPGMEVESTRAKIEAGLGVLAYDYYGLAEIGPTFASECTEKAGLHWAEDHHFIEIVDPETKEPVPEGEVGIVVVTHLTRQATPMIRYWTNDYARLVRESCACGRTHARSPGGILGRADDMVIYRGAKFYPTQVEKVIRSLAELGDEFRIELSHDDASGIQQCKVIAEHLAPAPQPDLAECLRRALRQELLVTPEVELQPVGTLERTTFKARRVIDKRK